MTYWYKRIPNHPISLGVFLCCLFAYLGTSAQNYQDHLGTGNDIGVKVTSSPVQGADSAQYSINGTGFFPDLAGASRFLAQAGFGGNPTEVEYVTQVGIDNWLKEQFDLPYTSYLEDYYTTFEDVKTRIAVVHPDDNISRSRQYADFVFLEESLQRR